MQGDQKFEVGENIEEVAKFGLFAKYILPFIVQILLGAIFLLLAVLFVPFLVTFFPGMDIKEIGGGIVAIIVLIMILAIGKKA